MKLGLSGLAGGERGALSGEAAKAALFAIDANLRDPRSARLFLDVADAYVLACAITMRPDVLAVKGVAALAKVRNAVITSYAVDVVNLIDRPITVNMKPSEAVAKVGFTVHPDSQVPSVVNRARRLTLNHSGSFDYAPSERACPGVVGRQITKP